MPQNDIINTLSALIAKHADVVPFGWMDFDYSDYPEYAAIEGAIIDLVDSNYDLLIGMAQDNIDDFIY